MKTAVVLFNLGGPDSPEAIKPFLSNLFSDRAIIDLPQPLRGLVATFITLKRLGPAREIYDRLGGRSPILEETRAQAEALEAELNKKGEHKVFIAMRYWNPLVGETVGEVKEYGPDRIVLLPLYPQFSTTTTQSAFALWYEEAQRQGLHVTHHPICCYPFDNYFILAHLELLRTAYAEASKHGVPRILFSAHGLPQKTIKKGDPYQWQVERTVAGIMRKFGTADHVVCYQSRLGPGWLGPSIQEEIRRAGKRDEPVIVVPVSFVSEHSETIVELDMNCRALAKKSRVPFYTRTPALGTHPQFIRALAWLTDATKLYPNCTNTLGHLCPPEFGRCGFREWKGGKLPEMEPAITRELTNVA